MQAQFGYGIAMSGDGRTLAVGAPNIGSGAGGVYVYRSDGVQWVFEAFVKSTNLEAADVLGASVALSHDGNTLASGAIGERSNAAGIDGNAGDNSLTGAGAAYVFVRTGSTWTQQAYVKASNTEANDSFGYTVALSGDGDTLAVCGYGESSAATGIDGDQTDNSVQQSGAVYVFARAGTGWSQQAYLKASTTLTVHFGFALALPLDGSTLAVSTPDESNGTGAAYVFNRAGTTWRQQAKVMASNAEVSDDFGSAVSLAGDGNTLAVGAPAKRVARSESAVIRQTMPPAEAARCICTLAQRSVDADRVCKSDQYRCQRCVRDQHRVVRGWPLARGRRIS